jgi:hypothetical protein
MALLITPCVVVSAGSMPRASSTMGQCRFDPDGYFYLQGVPPEGFGEIGYMELRINTRRERQPPSDSRLYARNGKVYRFTKLTAFGTHSSGGGITFEFETEIIEGVSYKFTGKFHSICILAEEKRDPQRIVAEGQLTKLKDGQEVKTTDVLWTYSKSPRRRRT